MKIEDIRDKNIEDTISNNNNQTSVDENDETFSNELINVEYNSSDKYGNTFYLNAERAFISLEDQVDNEVNLQGVVSIINIKNRGIINIFSKKAIYNKKTSIIELFENVKIIRGSEIITGDYGTFDTIKNSYKVKSNNTNKVKVVITNTDE